MKFNFIWEFKVNEVEARLIVDTILGWGAFFFGVFFDPIAKHFTLQHQVGIGVSQFLWCAFWGLYNIWTLWQFNNWKE